MMMMYDEEESGSEDELIVGAFQDDSASSDEDREAVGPDNKKRTLPDGSHGNPVKKQCTSRDLTERNNGSAEELEAWTERTTSLMLNLRLQLSKIFERDDVAVHRRGWKKIASMLFPLDVTGDDCLRRFNSTMEMYLASYDPNLGAIARSEREAEHFSFIEKLLRKSPKVRQQYLTDHTVNTCTASEVSQGRSNKEFLESLADDHSLVVKSFRQLVKIRERQNERDRVFEEIIQDIIAMQEQKHDVERAFLRKFIYAEFNTRDEQLGMLAQMLMCLCCSDSVPVSVLEGIRREVNERADRWYSTCVSMCAYSTSLEQIFDGSDEEDSLFLQLLPDGDHFFMPSAALAHHVILNEFGFKGLLRIERTTVEKVIEVFGPSAPAKIGKFKPLSVERVALLSLWYMVHDETFYQLSIRFSIRLDDVSRAISTFVSVFADAADLIQWPESPSDIKKFLVRLVPSVPYTCGPQTVLGFENMRDASFPGVIGAVGTKTFCCRLPDIIMEKKLPAETCLLEYDVCVQAVADSNNVFRHVDVKYIVGNEEAKASVKRRKTVDVGPETVSLTSKMFSCSPLSDALAQPFVASSKENKLAPLPKNLHVLGDSTYPLMVSLMVPFGSEEGLKPIELLFNKHLEMSWSAVGKAFGKATNRFRRLSYLDYPSKNGTEIIKAIFAVHNICMMEGDNYPARKVVLNDFPMWFHESTPSPEAFQKRQTIMAGFVHEKIDYAFRGKLPIRSVSLN